MKKNHHYSLLALLVSFLLISNIIQAQSPQAFKYQAVARNNLGQVLANQNIGLKISIIQTSPVGSVVY